MLLLLARALAVITYGLGVFLAAGGSNGTSAELSV